MECKICTSCRHENPVKNNFCTQCGAKLSAGAEFQARLRVLFGEPAEALFLLRKGRTSIGHDSGNVIVLGDELISNKHALIVFEHNGYWIEDRMSKNGVFVNRHRISDRQLLDDGSVVRLGSTILRFETNTE